MKRRPRHRRSYRRHGKVWIGIVLDVIFCAGVAAMFIAAAG